jgi:hypothetical protein
MYERQENIHLVVTHVLCISKFSRLGDLGIYYVFIFPKVVGELLVYLSVG